MVRRLCYHVVFKMDTVLDHYEGECHALCLGTCVGTSGRRYGHRESTVYHRSSHKQHSVSVSARLSAVGVIGFIALILFALYVGFVYRQDRVDRGFIVLATIIALVPYVRYLVLHNHSYIHCFFTFRAQAATVMAIVLIIARFTQKPLS